MSVNSVGVGRPEEDWAVSSTLHGIEPRLRGDGSGVKFSCHLLAVTSGKSRILFDLHAPLGPVFGRMEEVAVHLVPSPSSHVGRKPLCAQTLTPPPLPPSPVNPLPRVLHVCAQQSPPGEALPTLHI